jgi:hypothetical protein
MLGGAGDCSLILACFLETKPAPPQLIICIYGGYRYISNITFIMPGLGLIEGIV